MLSCKGGGQAVQASLSCPHPLGYQSKIIVLVLLILNYLNVEMYSYKQNSSKIQLFSLSHCSVYLVTGVWGGGGKLSRPVYLAPHPLGYKSKIILLILLILNYLIVKMYQL